MSTQDIVERIRGLLQDGAAVASDEGASETSGQVVALSADAVAIADLPAGATDRIKHLGTFTVSVTGEGWPEAVVKTVEVVAEEQ